MCYNKHLCLEVYENEKVIFLLDKYFSILRNMKILKSKEIINLYIFFTLFYFLNFYKCQCIINMLCCSSSFNHKMRRRFNVSKYHTGTVISSLFTSQNNKDRTQMKKVYSTPVKTQHTSSHHNKNINSHQQDLSL